MKFEEKINIIEWWGEDVQVDTEDDDDSDNEYLKEYFKNRVNEEYYIYIYGKTQSGKSVELEIVNFFPFYYIKNDFDEQKNQIFKQKINDYVENSFWMCKPNRNYHNPFLKDKTEIVKSKDIYGFNNEKEESFLKLFFKSKKGWQMSRNSLFKSPIKLFNKQQKAKLYESNFEPFMRFAHLNKIKMAGWIQLQHIIKQNKNDKVDFSFTLDYRQVVGVEMTDVAPFKQMCWDIEVYSHNYLFPNPKDEIQCNNQSIYPNEIYQIGITLKDFKSDKIDKFLLTSKQTNLINDVNLIVYPNEKDLILNFADFIQSYNPDILFGYNTDSFDFDYVIKRCELLNIKKQFLQQISRNQEIKAQFKKDFFSSSAYGDNEFNRVYIPGRLNYDLIVHFKRGVSKFSSYSLNHIAQQILNESKHEVSAKDIFKSYESNDPEKLKIVAEYCVQDTVLLQKLVDNQIILLNVIQLANCTSVPIGYLLTKGQTIKVLSQIMKKSQEMNYLVPHTNFNSDVNFLSVKLYKKPEQQKDFFINKLIKIECGQKEYEFNDKKYTKQFIIDGIIQEFDDKNLLIIKTNTSLDDNEIIYNPKRCIISSQTNNSTLMVKVKSVSQTDEQDEDSFTGATVLEPQRGLYTDDIVVLDFASLYPTIMISRNLCFSTFISQDSPWNDMIKCQELGIKVEQFQWEDVVEYKINKKCQKIMTSGQKRGEKCNKNALFHFKECDLFSCNDCFLNESNLKIFQQYQPDYQHKNLIDVQQLQCDICQKNATWQNDVYNYCSKCKNQEDENYGNVFKIDVQKCSFCAKKSTKCLKIKGDFYYCLIHDEKKSTRKDEDKKLQKKVIYDYKIVQQQENKHKGVIPSLLEDLYMERKKVKKLMKQAQGLEKDIMDCQQLSIKICLNSVYGFMGRTKGNLVKKELGQITTAVGRQLIEQSKQYVESFDTKNLVHDFI